MKNKKNKKNNKKKILIIIIIMAMLILIGMGIVSITNFSQENKNNNKVNEVVVIDNIEKYNYSLNDNATDYYKELFEDLKVILNKEEINEEEYAKKISQLFVTDLFTLQNKLTSSDIGGTQFVYKDFLDDFIPLAQNSIYSSVKNNLYGTREQELPEVKETTVKETITKDFKFDKKTFENAYYITVEINYVKDMGYPSKYQIVLVKNENVLQVVKGQQIK